MTRTVILKTETTVSAQQDAVLLDSTNAVELIEKFNEAKSVIKQMEAQKSEAEKALRELMGNAELGLIAGVERVKIATRNRTDIDKETLKVAFPEAFVATQKHSTYTVLTATS
jgi:predicted phage-related endonuclease